MSRTSISQRRALRMRQLLNEMYRLLCAGDVQMVISTRGGIWTWPDRCRTATVGRHLYRAECERHEAARTKIRGEDK
jgi:hypothetical protein